MFCFGHSANLNQFPSVEYHHRCLLLDRDFCRYFDLERDLDRDRDRDRDRVRDLRDRLLPRERDGDLQRFLSFVWCLLRGCQNEDATPAIAKKKKKKRYHGILNFIFYVIIYYSTSTGLSNQYQYTT